MTINEERVGEINFSDPYFIAKGRILVKADNDEITGVDSLAGKNVCTALGSTYEATIKEQAPDAKLKLVDSYSECLELLQNGSVDAISTDDVILTGMIIQTGDELKLVGDELTQEPYGAGIKKDDQELTDFVNEVFTEYKDERPVGRDLREVGRQVHGRGGGGPDDLGRRGRRAGQEERGRVAAAGR